MNEVRKIQLDGGKEVVVKEQPGRRVIIVRGHGSMLSISPAEAAALFGVLRNLDNEGYLS